MDEHNTDLEWLIRDNSNVIRGPYKHSEVLQLIKKGQLKGKTEVSRANSYWFAVEEKAEVARFFPELGLRAPEQPTQMTATLTQADLGDRGVEVTQFTAAPTRKELMEGEPADETTPSTGTEKIEWLSDDMAEEFGEEAPISLQTDPSIPVGKGAKRKELEPEKPEPTPDELARQEMLKRATVKADTLPSEHKGYTGDRPKPINAVLKAPERPAPTAAPAPANVVSVPVNVPEAQARILEAEEENPAEAAGKKKMLLFAGGTLLFLVAATAAFTLWPGSGEQGSEPRAARAISGSPEAAVRKALILFHLEGAKEAMAEFELEPSSRGSLTLPMAQALLKKEFLYDADGAVMSLQTARSLAGNKKLEAEVDNLMAGYRFDRDRGGSVEVFRRVVGAFPSESVFRYNLALAQIRSGSPAEAIGTATALVDTLGRNDALSEDLGILLGWAKDLATRGMDPSVESSYLRALDANPNSAKAHLGLAIYRLRKGGMRESEGDFRAFLEALPDLDPPTRALNYRKMSDFDFYNYARTQIRELNIPMGAAGSKPSPLVMAVDAVLSCLQSRTAEAGKILEGALSAAPGDYHLLKAVGYHRWKEGRHAEIVDLLRDQPKERNSFSVNLLLGKAYLKIGRRDLAESYFERLTQVSPMRSEGWSLLGDVQLQQGRLDVARKNLENALSRDPLDLLALRGLDRLGATDVITPDIAANLPF